MVYMQSSGWLCRCERSDIKLSGPQTPAEQHVDYEMEAGYVKVSRNSMPPCMLWLQRADFRHNTTSQMLRHLINAAFMLSCFAVSADIAAVNTMDGGVQHWSLFGIMPNVP